MGEMIDTTKKTMSKTMGVMLGCSGCLVLVIVAIIVIAVAGAGASKTSSNTDKAASSTITSTPSILLIDSGNGTHTTKTFTVPSDSWTMDWSYDCSSFGQDGNFQVYVYSSDGSLSLDNSPLNNMGMKQSGTENFHKAGKYYLTINSECSWNISVKG